MSELIGSNFNSEAAYFCERMFLSFIVSYCLCFSSSFSSSVSILIQNGVPQCCSLTFARFKTPLRLYTEPYVDLQNDFRGKGVLVYVIIAQQHTGTNLSSSCVFDQVPCPCVRRYGRETVFSMASARGRQINQRGETSEKDSV